MNTKALLLPILPLALLASSATAQPPAVKTRVRATTVERTTFNLYRGIPRGANSDATKQRFRVTYYQPTMFYYTRDGVISYGYTAVVGSAQAPDAGNYYGPHGAVFIPEADQLPGSAAVWNYATVTKRTQPGVGMAPASAAAKKPITRVEKADSGKLAQK